jgi:hypothetical protein
MFAWVGSRLRLDVAHGIRQPQGFGFVFEYLPA